MMPSYDVVANEYYDEVLHPTCADLRDACRVYLRRIFQSESLQGRIADIGSGQSLILEMLPPELKVDLILVDESERMLSCNENILRTFEVRNLNVENAVFGEGEFDWVFAILGDPFNTPRAWDNIYRALHSGGECVFVVPSFVWAEKFRLRDGDERPGFARFLIATGASVFLPSSIVSEQQQKRMIDEAGLVLTDIEHVTVAEVPKIRSKKISKILLPDDAVLDIYRAKKPLM